MRSRYSLTSSPLKKAPSIYKRSPKKKFSITNQNSSPRAKYSTQYDNIITEEIVEEKATPKKPTLNSTVISSPSSPQTPYSPNEGDESLHFQETGQSTSFNRSSKSRTKSDSFFQPNKSIRPIDDLKYEYQELTSLYNNALQRRSDLKNECNSLESELQQAYRQQSKLCHHLKKKANSETAPSRK